MEMTLGLRKVNTKTKKQSTRLLTVSSLDVSLHLVSNLGQVTFPPSWHRYASRYILQRANENAKGEFQMRSTFTPLPDLNLGQQDSETVAGRATRQQRSNSTNSIVQRFSRLLEAWTGTGFLAVQYQSCTEPDCYRSSST